MTFTASNALSGQASTAITIANVDRAPAVTAPATASGSEGTLLTFGVTASDPDGDTISSLTAAPLPSGATFTPNGANTSGTFDWTPTFTQAGSYNVTFTATNALSGGASTAITITNVDRAPLATAPATASGSEGTLLTFGVTASDPDLDPITSLDAAPLPPGATFTPNGANTSGTFDWTPSFTQAGSYNVTFTASNALSGQASTAITIANVDRAPAVTAPATASGPENALLTFGVSASDPDGDPIASLTAAPLPSGATFTANGANTSGTFDWTPTFTQAGSYNVTFTATNALSGGASTAITITNVDRAPLATAAATASGSEGTLLTFGVTASDPDGDTISSLTAAPLPSGATFTPNGSNTSGTFDWTPSFTQAGSYNVTFTASNALSGQASTAITIANVDRAPAVTAPATASGAENALLTFTVTASDPDGDPIASLTASPLPSGATFTPNGAKTSGTFDWTPSFAQAGSYDVTFTASNALSGQASTAITVTNVDRAPAVTAPATASGPENVLLTFTVTASDPDGDPIASLTAAPLPSGATFTPNGANTSGTFDWTPSFAQAGSYNVTFTASNAMSGQAPTAITITNVDRAPLATAPATASGSEGALLTIGVTASDPDGDTISSLTAAPLPTGATFTPNGANTSGTLDWTPSFTQAGSYNVTFTASNASSGQASTAITIADVDRAPGVTAQATASGPENALLTFTVTASDPDGDPIASLTAAPLPSGATFTPNGANTSGSFDWTPTFAQAGSYNVTFTASNALSGQASTAITIANVDRAPAVTAPATASGSEGALVAFTVTASDPDGDPIASLTGAPLPAGATFIPDGSNTTGTFDWTPSFTQAGSYNVTFAASNALSGQASTAITIANVDRAPVLDAIGNQTVVEGVTLDVPLHASDPDLDPVALSGTLPAFASVVPGASTPGDITALLRLEPTAGAEGVYSARVTSTSGALEHHEDFLVVVTAATCEPVAKWTRAFAAPALTPKGDGEIGGNLTFAAAGSGLTAVRSERFDSDLAGQDVWTWQAPGGATIETFSSPITLSAGGEVLFIATSDGTLHKVNVATGTTSGAPVDLRRPGCPADRITATPAVQLYSFSNAGYQAQMQANDDLVFVVTRYGCGTTTENRVYALHASDLSTAWTFNATGSEAMGAGREGCTVDYERNRIYCGTEQTAAQSSLWALESMTGTEAWSANAGSIQNRPILHGSKLYVTTANGFLRALDPASSGAELWSLNLTNGGGGFVTSPVIATMEESPGNQVTSLYCGDNTGALRRVNLPASGTGVLQWKTRVTHGVTSAPAVASAARRVYVGVSDGTVRELSAATGQDLAAAVVDSGVPVTGAAIDVWEHAASSMRLLVSAGTKTQRFCVPWTASGMVTAVEPTSPAPSSELVLEQNRPNPFNPVTRVRFHLPRSERARLVVFDVHGRMVRVLVDGLRSEGPHDVTWDGRDEAGREAASGVYLVRLEAPSGTASRKAILTR
ncbi:MAG TPA: putative Ig domain-containing protein [Candidatus Eisenbacteria bacterium]|nr:putative Ig domain-containing protein [Candidatus Eisenbacteria bacterium]